MKVVRIDLAQLLQLDVAQDGRMEAELAAVGRLLCWAWEHAMPVAYLQVTSSNAPALAIYQKLGFRTVYSYHYLARPRDVER